MKLVCSDFKTKRSLSSQSPAELRDSLPQDAPGAKGSRGSRNSRDRQMEEKVHQGLLNTKTLLLAHKVTDLQVAEGFKTLHGGGQQRLVLSWISSLPKGPRAGSTLRRSSI